MPTNFPTTLDTDTELFQTTDGVHYPLAAHHNNPKDAVKALEAKVGIDGSAVASSLDYLLKHLGGLIAASWVEASDGKAKVKLAAQLLQSFGYPVWVCDGASDDVQIQAAIGDLP